VTFTPTIQPVCLATTSPYDFEEASVAGWGKTSQQGPLSSKLRTVQMKLKTQAECTKIYQGTPAPPITSGMVCAGERSADACNGKILQQIIIVRFLNMDRELCVEFLCIGDSGGPLTSKNNDQAIQVGIVSWGKLKNLFGTCAFWQSQFFYACNN